MKKMTMNKNAKSYLAKLLATENISVEHKKVQTAYFDVKSRLLVLPIWKDMNEDITDLLIAHEVGHALFTPQSGWEDSIVKRKIPKSFLNVLEDARIEKLIKRKYRGQLNNSGAAVYGYDGDASDGWTIWNQAFSDSNPGTLIAPGQGFFVSANVGGGQISFNPSMRAIGNSNDFIVGRNNSSSTFNHLKLKIDQNENSYYTDFYFNPNANRGLDKGYDAELWGGIVPNFAIYSFLVNSNSGLPFAIQSLNEFDYSDVVIPIGVNASLGEEMIISLDENTLPENISIYMEDHLTYLQL